jgi:hypothetical protein
MMSISVSEKFIGMSAMEQSYRNNEIIIKCNLPYVVKSVNCRLQEVLEVQKRIVNQHGYDEPSVEQYDTHQRDDMTNKTSAKKFCSMRSTRALMSMGYLPCAGGAWTTRTGVRGLIPSRESASAQRKEG